MRKAWAGTLLAAGLVLTGCANQSGSADAEGSASSAKASARTQTDQTSSQISTSSWSPGDGGRAALIRGTLGFTPDGCPHLGAMMGVVWPADYTSILKADGKHVIVTADGRQISAGDTVIAGGAAAATEAKAGMPCIEPGTTLTLIQSPVKIVPSG